MLYLDHNATAPLHPAARAAWLDAHDRFPANPASAHRLGQRADFTLEAARETLAALLDCPSQSLVWTSGATEAAATILAHLAAVSPPEAPLWISAIEHPCVSEAAAYWFPNRVRELPVSPSGRLELAPLAGALTGPRPAAVVLMAANNETGVLQPWQEALAACRASGVPFVCDATQWLGRLPARGLGACDYLFASAHKCGAPVGIGFLKTNTPLGALLRGGAQEEGRRAGTRDVAGAVALVAALEACGERFQEVDNRLALRAQVESELLRAAPGARVLGAGVDRLWNTCTLLLPALGDCRQRWVVRLDAAGVAASAGSACASGQEKPSRVLAAMGVAAQESDRSVRFSAGWDTTPTDWAELVRRTEAIWSRWGVRG